MTQAQTRPKPPQRKAAEQAGAAVPLQTLETAIILETEGSTIRGCFADGRIAELHRAYGCLLEPRVDDRVLVAGLAGTAHLIQILDRPEPADATLSVPGAPSLTLEQSDMTVRADSLAVETATVTLKTGSGRLIGKALTAIADGLEVVAQRVRRVAGQESSTAEDSVRVVANTETVKARHLVQESEQTMSLRSSGVVVVDAASDVRVNGERISLG